MADIMRVPAVGDTGRHYLGDGEAEKMRCGSYAMMLWYLDAKIAQALGYVVTKDCYEGPYTMSKSWAVTCPTCSYDGLWSEYRVPAFSSDGSSMLILDEEMRERGYDLISTRVVHEGKCLVTARYFKDGEERICLATTLPEAVALAAYEILTGREWRQ